MWENYIICHFTPKNIEAMKQWELNRVQVERKKARGIVVQRNNTGQEVGRSESQPLTTSV